MHRKLYYSELLLAMMNLLPPMRVRELHRIMLLCGLPLQFQREGHRNAEGGKLRPLASQSARLLVIMRRALWAWVSA